METTDGQPLDTIGVTDGVDDVGKTLESSEVNASLADPSRLRKATVGAEAIHGAGVLTQTSGRKVACRGATGLAREVGGELQTIAKQAVRPIKRVAHPSYRPR